MPFQAFSLKLLSSMPPVSLTMHALKSTAAAGRGLGRGLGRGALRSRAPRSRARPVAGCSGRRRAATGGEGDRRGTDEGDEPDGGPQGLVLLVASALEPDGPEGAEAIRAQQGRPRCRWDASDQGPM